MLPHVRTSPLLVLALISLALPLLVLAQPSLMSAAAQEQPGEPPTSTMLVLDASGSMDEPVGGGSTKIAAARRALSEVVASLPDDAAVGMRVFGAEVFSRDEPGACTDSQEVVTPGVDNREDLLAEIERYRPYGETPIGYALREAARDLDPSSSRSIVLVSDGVATCDPDPCEVARELAGDGVDLRVDVVGLAVDSAARTQLRCIAAAAGGTYYDADSAEEITALLSTVTERALRPFEIDGEPVTGGETQSEALTLGPGRYVDSFSGDLTERWYLYEPQLPGSTVLASFYELASGGLGDIDLSLFDTTGGGCGTGPVAVIVPLFSGSTRVAPAEGSSSCEGPVLIRAVRTGGESSLLPFGLSVVEEPAVLDVEDLPATDDPSDPVTPPRPRGRAETITPGSSFESAPRLESGTTYRTTIVPGEVNAFKVAVGWGQSLAVRVDRPGLTTAQDRAVSERFSYFSLQVSNPLRAAVSDAFEATDSDRRLRDEPTTQLAGVGPVRWANRDFRTNGAHLAGDYYVLYGADVDSPVSVELPYRITVEVQGEENGAPSYAAPGELVVTDDQLTQVSPPTPGSSDPEATGGNRDEPDAGPRGEPGDRSPATWAVVTGALIALLTGGAVLLLRRRRSSD